MTYPENHIAVRLHPPSHDIRVEELPAPKIEHPDDAIVKVTLAGLCGSDLHPYRGHQENTIEFVTGHEFIGEVVALGSSFGEADTTQPALYSKLAIGDKVVSPFSSSCAECTYCRAGFTSRCVHSLLFGSSKLPGGQAQYVRVPNAGGTLFKVPSSKTDGWSSFSDESLLLLSDILPTGCFAALQLLQHPKLQPFITGKHFPTFSSLYEKVAPNYPINLGGEWPDLQGGERDLKIAVVGLGPVGICAMISLLDLLERLQLRNYRVVAIDLLDSRRFKMLKILDIVRQVQKVDGEVHIVTPEDGKRLVSEWTDHGCNGALEIVGNNPAIRLAYELLGQFGVIVSVGVHQSPQIPFMGSELYLKNVAFEFGRCPVRAMFPLAMDLLLRRQEIFATVGRETSLIDRIAPLHEAKKFYDAFDKGECGKVLFKPFH